MSFLGTKYRSKSRIKFHSNHRKILITLGAVQLWAHAFLGHCRPPHPHLTSFSHFRWTPHPPISRMRIFVARKIVRKNIFFSTFFLQNFRCNLIFYAWGAFSHASSHPPLFHAFVALSADPPPVSGRKLIYVEPLIWNDTFIV